LEKSLVIGFTALLFVSFPLSAQSIVEPGAIAAQVPGEAPRPFGDNHFGVSTNRNFPLGPTRANFAPTKRQNFSVIYRRTLSVEWMAGIQGGFKSFEFRDRGGTFSILSVTHEIYRLIRVYHPWYLGIGYRVHYLAPVIEQSIPTERLPDSNAEVGVAGSMMFITRLAPEFVAFIQLDRWRGTKTNELHGYEFALGFAYDGYSR
jgi:hypothetical protein